MRERERERKRKRLRGIVLSRTDKKSQSVLREEERRRLESDSIGFIERLLRSLGKNPKIKSFFGISKDLFSLLPPKVYAEKEAKVPCRLEGRGTF